jgi:hypothetical protein
VKRCVAGVVELVDTPASGAGARKGVEVQVLSPVPNTTLKEQTKKPRNARLFCICNLSIALIGILSSLKNQSV